MVAAAERTEAARPAAPETRSGLAMLTAVAAFFLLTGYSTAMTAIFWSVRAAIFLVIAIIVGLFAAIFPARRAARLNPLDALAYE